MVDRAAEAAGRLGREVRCQRRNGLVVVARVVGELDGDGLGRALRDRAVQLLDGALGLDALVESDEAHSLRQTCNAQIQFVHPVPIVRDPQSYGTKIPSSLSGLTLPEPTLADSRVFAPGALASFIFFFFCFNAASEVKDSLSTSSKSQCALCDATKAG